jgi:hypothetical protein
MPGQNRLAMTAIPYPGPNDFTFDNVQRFMLAGAAHKFLRE